MQTNILLVADDDRTRNILFHRQWRNCPQRIKAPDSAFLS